MTRSGLSFTLAGGLLAVLFAVTSSPGVESRNALTLINGWYKTACLPENLKDNRHYICARNGSMICLPGWTDEYTYCSTPICDPTCVNGNCTAPNTCTCDVGWFGGDCSECVCLPGCRHGDCRNPFECNCEEGWTGMFCDKPICKEGCVNGKCSVPGECHCHPGWTGENCDICIRSPDCVNGFCNKPMDCICEPGFLPPDCKRPICRDGCNATYGFCKNPGECWCRPGWEGPNCDRCQTYEGCVNGFCINPWDCICEPGFTGMLCDQRVTASVQDNRPVRSQAAADQVQNLFDANPFVDDFNANGLDTLPPQGLPPSQQGGNRQRQFGK